MVHDVVKGLFGPTAVAHFTILRTHNHFHFRQVVESPVRQKVRRFNRFDGCNGPTSAATVLGAHVRDGAHVAPIDRRGIRVGVVGWFHGRANAVKAVNVFFKNVLQDARHVVPFAIERLGRRCAVGDDFGSFPGRLDATVDMRMVNSSGRNGIVFTCNYCLMQISRFRWRRLEDIVGVGISLLRLFSGNSLFSGPLAVQVFSLKLLGRQVLKVVRTKHGPAGKLARPVLLILASRALVVVHPYAKAVFLFVVRVVALLVRPYPLLKRCAQRSFVFFFFFFFSEEATVVVRIVDVTLNLLLVLLLS